LPLVAAHGWVTLPVSKNELAKHHWVDGMPDPNGGFRYEPQSCNFGNGIGELLSTGGSACGAEDAAYAEGLHLWAPWYDAAQVPVPQIAPGQTLEVNVTITIDHGGQAWMLLACAEQITDDAAWTVLPRAPSDRAKHFMPSAPGAFAWAPQEYGFAENVRAAWVVPDTFQCSTGRVVGRWVWKTGNTCNDFENKARPTEKFTHDDYLAVVQQHDPGSTWVNPPCKSPPEEFIACLDFEFKAPLMV